jgi:hypothetical protein
MPDESRTTDVTIFLGAEEPITLRVGLSAETVRMLATAAEHGIRVHYSAAYADGWDDAMAEILDVLGPVDGPELAIKHQANRKLAHELGDCGRFKRACPLCVAQKA